MTQRVETYIEEALQRYPLTNPKTTFLRHNENITCKVVEDKQVYALRIRLPREGFELKIFEPVDPITLLQSEMDLLSHIEKAALFPVQRPVQTKTGESVAILDNEIPACLLHWLEGEPLNKETAITSAYEIGQLAAKIHLATQGFTGARLTYNSNTLGRMRNEMDVAFSRSHISLEQTKICKDTLEFISSLMAKLDQEPDSVALLHADMGFGNLIQTKEGLAPIDFSLSGYGYRAQECGMIASNYQSKEQQDAVSLGYFDECGFEVPTLHRDSFLALSVLLFISCQHDRFFMEEWYPSAVERWCTTLFLPLIKRS